MSTVEFHPWNSRRADTEKPRRVAHRPRPRAGVRLRDGTAGRARRPRGPRRAGRGRLPQDQRQQGAARLRPDPPRPRLQGRTPGRARVRPRGGAPGARGRHHHLVAQGPRPRRVFPDYNQNARDHTIAAAYSVRGLPDARVSTPIRWDEVDDVDPRDFTIFTVPRALRRARRPARRHRRPRLRPRAAAGVGRARRAGRVPSRRPTPIRTPSPPAATP